MLLYQVSTGMLKLNFWDCLYGKCPKISNTLYHTFLSVFLMHLLHKTFGGKVSSVDPDQTVQEQPDLGLQYSALCIYMNHSYSIR